MATSKGIVRGGQSSREDEEPRSTAIAKQGVATSDEFIAVMAALATDVLSGAVEPLKANTAVRAYGTMLKAVEMQLKWGNPQSNGRRVLQLSAKRVSK